MSTTQKPTNSYVTKSDYQGSDRERIAKAEKQSFIACVAAAAGFPAAFVGFGMLLGIAGFVLGYKAKRPDGTRHWGSIVAMILGALSVPIGIVGFIVVYGVVYEMIMGQPSETILKLVQAIFGTAGMLML